MNVYTENYSGCIYVRKKKKCVHYTVEERVNVVWEH